LHNFRRDVRLLKSGQDGQTIRSYFLLYKESGEYSLVQINYTGQEPFLSEKQQAELAASRREHLSFEPGDLSLCQSNLRYRKMKEENDNREGAKKVMSDEWRVFAS
jgi:hypothetical protein